MDRSLCFSDNFFYCTSQTTGNVVCADDTVIEKLYSQPDLAELIDYYWSGKHRKPIKGINLIISISFFTCTVGVGEWIEGQEF